MEYKRSKDCQTLALCNLLELQTLEKKRRRAKKAKKDAVSSFEPVNCQRVFLKFGFHDLS